MPTFRVAGQQRRIFVGVFSAICPVLANLFLLISHIISEDFWFFLSFLSDRNVFSPPTKCAESTAITGKIKKKQKSSLITKEKVKKGDLRSS